MRYNIMRFSINVKGQVSYSDVIGTIALILTVVGLFL